MQRRTCRAAPGRGICGARRALTAVPDGQGHCPLLLPSWTRLPPPTAAGQEQESRKHPVPGMVLCARPASWACPSTLLREDVSLPGLHSCHGPSLGTGESEGAEAQRGPLLAFPFYAAPLVSTWRQGRLWRGQALAPGDTECQGGWLWYG